MAEVIPIQYAAVEGAERLVFAARVGSTDSWVISAPNVTTATKTMPSTEAAGALVQTIADQMLLVRTKEAEKAAAVAAAKAALET